MMNENTNRSVLAWSMSADSGQGQNGTGCFTALMILASKICMGIAGMFVLAMIVDHLHHK